MSEGQVKINDVKFTQIAGPLKLVQDIIELITHFSVRNLPILYLSRKLFLQAVVKYLFTLSSVTFFQVKQMPHEGYQVGKSILAFFSVSVSWISILEVLAFYLDSHLTMECLASQDTTFLFP